MPGYCSYLNKNKKSMIYLAKGHLNSCDWMKKIFKNQRELITIASYVVIVAALVYFVVFQLLWRINSIKDQIQEENLRQEIAEQQMKELPKIEKQYGLLLKNKEMVDILLDKNDAVVLIEKLEKFAEDSGNKITISVQDTLEQSTSTRLQSSQNTSSKSASTIIDKLPSKNYLQMKIGLTGNYNTIINFIRKLESFEYYGDIIGIQIMQNESAGNQPSKADPFSLNTAEVKQETENLNQETLEASLDVVFYTKN